MKRRVCALLMCCALVVAMVPSSVLAAGDTSDESEEKATQEVAQESEETSGASFQSEDGTIMITPSNDEDEDEKADDTENVSDEAEDETGEVTEEESEEDDEEDEDVTYTAKNENIRVEVTAPSGALPEGAKLHVERYDEDSSEYRDAAKAIGMDPDTEEDTGMAALDISFLLDGNEVEPTEPVKVSIDASAILPADADAASMEVQHLVENGNEVTPVVVANTSSDTEGTIDEAKATAEFEVASFSSFTITWAGNEAGENSTEVTVYLYDTNGLGIYDSDEQATYPWAAGEHTIAGLLEEHVTGKIGEGYTYAYATVGYLTTSAMGGEVTTIGSADDSVVSVSWDGTSYIITTSSGSTTVASSDADEFYINLYFSTPSVTISVTDADTTNHTVSLTAETAGFQDSDIIYSWEITSGSEYASITGDGANATVTWNEGDESGTDITVKVTATSASGETATATYDLEYGMTQVTYTVYYDNGRTLASGAHVAIYDESGNLVSNGEADESGQVTLWIIPGTTYTLEASYTASSGTGIQATYTHYSYEDTNYVYVGDGTDNTTINLEASDANFYEHIDVKLSIAEEDAGYSDILSNVDYVKIYDEEGELVYQSSQLVHNEGTNDYNVLFADADGNVGTNPHSIAFYDTYTIEIAYEVSYTYTDDSGNSREYTESYVATIDKNSTYVDGEYYSYNGTNAYQLYNEMYGTDYDATSFAAAVAASAAGEEGGLENYNANGISLDGLTYFYVAAALCDTKDMTGQAGLDLALGVTSMRRYSSTTWNFDVQKTLKNAGAEAGAFSFSLYDATVSDSTWSVNVSDDYEFTLSNGTMIMADGSTDSVANMSGLFSFDFDSSMVGQTQTYYFVLVEDAGDNENITYSDAVYGVKVEVTLNSSTDMNDVTITETAYNLTESESSDEAYRTFTQGEEFDGSVDDDGYTIFPFVNEYDAKGSVSFGVTKTITGRSSTAKSFTFALYEADENFSYNAETLLKNESTTGTLTENEAQSVVFDTDIEYTEGGTYYYVIKEVTSSGNGWTCDGTEYHITVATANDGSGNIVPTEVTYTAVDSEGNTLSSGTLSADDDGVYGISGDSTLDFVNTYSDAEGDVIFGGTKSIKGTNSTTADFAFGLYDADENFTIDTSKEVHATTVTGAGDFAFTEIDYTEAGTYYYVVKETTEDGSGWTVDGTEYHITVVVEDATSDEGIGTFTITVSCTDAEGNEVGLTQTQDEETGIYTITGLDFENSYDASGSLNLTATKDYTGAELTEGEFNFTITETTAGVEEDDLYTGTGTNDADGNITFTPAIEYGLSDVGTHTYEIAETAGNAGGVKYDSNKITVTVVVEDAGDGTLTTTVTVDDSEIEATDGSYNVGTFNNTYEATGGVTLTATKKYTGATMTAGQFEFQIAETSGEYLGTGTNDADGNITFSPEITYTLDDVGTHTYRIVEVNGYAGGVTYDDSEIIVTVVVADNGDGTLSTTVTVDGEGVTAGDDGAYNVGTFENSYKATGSVTFGGEKTISGKDEETSQQFTFELYTTGSDFTVAENADATDTKTVTGAGSFTFETISYDSDEEGNGEGTYYYVVKETATNENGWTSDTKEYRITVVVADAGNGTFALTVTCVDAEGQTVVLTGTDSNGVYNFTGLDFTNEYEPAPISVQFTGSKYITNSASDESTDKVFTFELYNADSSFATDGDAIDTKTTTGAGSITFDEIEYKETGTYYYVIQEKALDVAEGWTIDPTVYNITVVVEDDGLGQLVATVTVNGTEVTGTDDVYGGFDFTNAYAAEGEVTLGVVKSISGVSSTNEEFEFTLYNSDESFATGDSIETITTDGTITNSTQLDFTAIPYTKAGTYYYVITETGTAPDGWTLDTKEYHVTVTVTDNGDGTLTTSASYAYVDENGETQTENSAAFTNTYAATGSLSLTGTKTFTGGTLETDGFTFTMTDSTGTSVGDVTMDANGNITFPTLTYDETDIGNEYTYTIAETKGEDSSVQYDETTYTVVVSVADNGDGTLVVTYTVNGTENGEITFTNYQLGSLIITKAFTGLTGEQIESLTDFTITVKNSDDETVATLTLDDADEGSAYTWTVNDLPADTYTVTESGYEVEGYEVVVTGSGESAEVVWGGEAKTELENDYTEVGSIIVSKYVTAEEDIQKAHEDTEYTVTITANDDVDYQWIEITSSLGREIKGFIDGRTVTFTITEDETVTISGLPAGEYTVEEQGSEAMTSEHCVPSYHVGGETSEEAPTVTVASGSENVVSVEIDNEYPVGTYIQVKKDYNKEYPTGEDAFTFTIEALSADLDTGDTLSANEMPMPTNSTVTITSSDDGYIGLITFDNEDNEFEHFGTYYYKITETKGSLDNVDYDTSVHYIKIVVGYDESTHVLTTDEYEAKADAETGDYKDLDYTEAGIVTAEFTNTAYDELTLEKEVSGNAGDTSEYEFEITLTKDGEGYTGDIETTDAENDTNPLTVIKEWFSGIVKMLAGDSTESIPFENGVGTVTVKAGESVTLLIPSGWDVEVTEKTTGADTTTVYQDGKAIVQAKGTTTQATAELGTIADSTQVKFVNSYRAYYPIDEEIVTDTDDIFDKDAWVKEESVNEYNAIEIEMTTNLPTVTGYDLSNGAFTMNFHEVLDSELVLDESDADFSVYIAGYKIDHQYYTVTIDPDDGCNFHVDVDLTALYNDGVVTDDMLDGSTEITIFFFADLEGTGLNGSYKSTIWYDIYDGDEWLYTSNESVVEVYTYEIEIQKYDDSKLEGDDYAGAALAGATLGVYYDKDCTEPVSRNNKAYTETSGKDGMVIFYGLAEGTYYVKETEAPEGYKLSDEVLTVELGSDLRDNGYAFKGTFANTPGTPDDVTGPGPAQPNPDTGTGPGPAQPNPGNGGPGTVKTSDTNNIALWLLLLVVSGGLIGTAGVRTIRKRKFGREEDH